MSDYDSNDLVLVSLQASMHTLLLQSKGYDLFIGAFSRIGGGRSVLNLKAFMLVLFCATSFFVDEGRSCFFRAEKLTVDL